MPRRRSPSRGKPRRGSRPVRHAEGLQPSGQTWRPATMGCSTGYGGGELSTLDHGYTVTRRGTFTPGESAHARIQSLPHPSSAQPTVDSRCRLARGVTRSSDLRRSTCWRSCTDQETAAEVRVWLAARLLSKEGGLSHTERVEGGARKAGANASTRARTRKEGPQVEASEDRTLEVVLARHGCCCRSRRTVAGAEKRTHLHFTRSGSVQGRAPSSQLQRTRVRSRG